MANEDRLIRAGMVKDKLANLEASGGHKYYRQGMNDVLHKFMPQILDDCPTVDAVEVVRCKECEHCEKDLYCRCHRWMGHPQIVKEDDFCSYGERRTDHV